MHSIPTRVAFALSITTLLAASCGSNDESLPACPNANSTLTYTNFGKNFLTTYCSSCHAANASGGARQGAPDSEVFDNIGQVQAAKGSLYEQVVTTEAMPFGTSTASPSAAERTSFGEWLACGAKE